LATTTLITAEEFEQMPESEHRELIRGLLSNVLPPGVRHGWIQIKLGGLLFSFVAAHGLGEVYGEIGILIEENPDTVMAPDLAFVRKANLPAEGMETSYLRHAPDLVVEILSPSDRTSQSLEKVMAYLSAGVESVWVVDPQRQHVMIWQSERAILDLEPGDTLDGGDVLPGFALPISDLFPE
jgi:Uma2 family endonuclease